MESINDEKNKIHIKVQCLSWSITGIGIIYINKKGK